MFRQITAELEDIADILEKRGDKRTAARIDLVCNSLDAIKPRTAAKDSPPVDSDDARESEHEDAFTAEHYHKVPVGKDSLSKAIGVNLKDIVKNLDFAQDANEKEGQTINVQSSRQAEKLEVDTGDRVNMFSTSGLEETGDEAKVHPNDEEQEGGDLAFFGTEKAGELHMKASMDKEAAMAKELLQRVAAEVIVKDPEELMDSEPGENVERDQKKFLGGRTEASKKAKKEDKEDKEEVCDEDDEECEESDKLASLMYEIPSSGRKASKKTRSSIRTIVE